MQNKAAKPAHMQRQKESLILELVEMYFWYFRSVGAHGAHWGQPVHCRQEGRRLQITLLNFCWQQTNVIDHWVDTC